MFPSLILFDAPFDMGTCGPLVLNPALGVAVVQGNSLELSYGASRFRTADPRIAELLREVIEGARSTAQLLVQSGEASVFRGQVILELLDAGILVEDCPLSSESKRFWLARKIAPAFALKRLGSFGLSLTAGGRSVGTDLTRLFALGMQGPKDHSPSRVVVCSGQELISVQQCLGERDRAMPVFRYGGSVFWGPLFDRNTPCPLCYQRIIERLGKGGTSEGVSEGIRSIHDGLGSLVDENALSDEMTKDIALAIVCPSQSQCVDEIRSMSTSEETRKHVVLPACTCSVRRSASAELDCDSQTKSRSEPALDVGTAEFSRSAFIRHYSFLQDSPLAIIQHREALRFTGLHSMAVIRYLFRYPDRRSLDVAWGKGISVSEAEVTGLGEVIERYSCSYWGRNEVERRITRSGLAGSSANSDIAPNAVMLFADQQFVGVPILGGPIHARRPSRCDASLLSSIKLRCVLTGSWFWVPEELIYFDVPNPSGKCLVDSSGVAAGSIMGDAVERAFLELVERDAFAIWWYNRISHPALNLGEFPGISALVSEHVKRGNRISCFDITTDLGIPVVAAYFERESSGIRKFEVATACHRDLSQAVRSAIAEVTLKYEVACASGVDGGGRLAAAEAAWILARSDEVIGVLERGLGLMSSSLEPNGADLLRVVLRHTGAARNAFVVDLTSRDIGCPVARVIVPGLRPQWPRFGPGRLFNVPVSMGWRATPLLYGELNQQPASMS